LLQLHSVDCAFYTKFESLEVKGFQDVINGAFFERFDSILVISGTKYHMRIVCDFVDDIKSCHSRHLNIEEHQIGFKLVNHFNGILALRGFA
jgi:hypothetical protein